MNEQQRKRIIDRHRDSLTRHGYHPNALYWSSREIQERRFAVLAEIGVEDGDRVLDVGCGFGDFLQWSEARGVGLDYTGIDLSPDILATARQRHAQASFYQGDLFDMGFRNASFDWVILSGALNEQLHDGSAYAFRVIEQMYALSRRGAAFNMLDARSMVAHDLHSQLPDRVLSHCLRITPDCTLRDDYLRNDFTIYMMK